LKGIPKRERLHVLETRAPKEEEPCGARATTGEENSPRLHAQNKIRSRESGFCFGPIQEGTTPSKKNSTFWWQEALGNRREEDLMTGDAMEWEGHEPLTLGRAGGTLVILKPSESGSDLCGGIRSRERRDPPTNPSKTLNSAKIPRQQPDPRAAGARH